MEAEGHELAQGSVLAGTVSISVLERKMGSLKSKRAVVGILIVGCFCSWVLVLNKVRMEI